MCGLLEFSELLGVSLTALLVDEHRVLKVTLIDECIMRVRLKHTLGFISFLQCMLIPRCVKPEMSCFMPNST